MVHRRWGGFGRHRRQRARWPLPAVGAMVMAAAALAVTAGLGPVTGSQAARAAAMQDRARAAGTAGRVISGIATHYVLQGLPNCSYARPPADGLFVALSPSEYRGAAACGGYLMVTGPHSTWVRVKVIDQCPECARGHIDLSERAFARLAPLAAGLIRVHYRYLVNPALPGPLKFEVKQGSSRWWLALLADNTGNPLSSVQVRTGSGGWRGLSRADYNFWIAQSGAGPGPFTVRLTDTRGHRVIVHGIRLRPGAVQSTRTWMYGD